MNIVQSADFSIKHTLNHIPSLFLCKPNVGRAGAILVGDVALGEVARLALEIITLLLFEDELKKSDHFDKII